MHKSDRTLIMRIETGGMTDEEEDRLVHALLRLVEKHGVAHVELPMPWAQS